MPTTPKKLIKRLRKNGFFLKRENGSHRFYFNPETKRRTIVPYHSKEIPKGTEHAILKQAGLKRLNKKL